MDNNILHLGSGYTVSAGKPTGDPGAKMIRIKAHRSSRGMAEKLLTRTMLAPEHASAEKSRNALSCKVEERLRIVHNDDGAGLREEDHRRLRLGYSMECLGEPYSIHLALYLSEPFRCACQILVSPLDPLVIILRKS